MEQTYGVNKLPLGERKFHTNTYFRGYLSVTASNTLVWIIDITLKNCDMSYGTKISDMIGKMETLGLQVSKIQNGLSGKDT